MTRALARLPLWAIVPAALILGLAASREPLLVLVAVVGLVLAGLGLRFPPLLVAGMFLGMLFDKLGLTGAKVSGFPITLSKLSVLGSLGVWGLRGLLSRDRTVRWHPVLTALLIMSGASAICVAWSNSMAEGKFIVFGLLMMAIMVGLVYAILAETELASLYRLIGVGLTLALLSSVLGAGGAGEAGRATGTFGDPNEWATMVLLLTGLVLGGLADDDSRLAQGLRLALLGLAPLSILMSASRSALVALTLCAPGLLYLLRHRRGEVLTVGALGVLAAPFVLDLGMAWRRLESLVGNLTGSAVVQDSSLNERTELFHQGVALFQDHWLLGAGPGNFGRATGFVTLEGKLRPAHNTYLEIAAEQGILGLGATAFFGLVVALMLRGALRSARTRRDHNRVVGAALGLGAVALMAATLGLLTFSLAYLALGISLAICHQAGRRG